LYYLYQFLFILGLIPYINSIKFLFIYFFAVRLMKYKSIINPEFVFLNKLNILKIYIINAYFFVLCLKVWVNSYFCYKSINYSIRLFLNILSSKLFCFTLFNSFNLFQILTPSSFKFFFLNKHNSKFVVTKSVFVFKKSKEHFISISNVLGYLIRFLNTKWLCLAFIKYWVSNLCEKIIPIKILYILQ
jgi:hypothetical protein